MKVVYVKDANAKNFEKQALQKQVFAKYFSPSCPACISMKEDWDHMCKDVNEKYNTDLIFAEIDPTGLKKLEESKKVHTSIDYVPAMMVLMNGKKNMEYNGNRSKEDMIKFLLKNKLIEPKIKGGKKKKYHTRKYHTRKSKTKQNKKKKKSKRSIKK
tara:strand:- start:8211 stop:8681 length:471 start_codon:yes stop_codon:yes gene_type:complete